jgi:hypothetical protein
MGGSGPIGRKLNIATFERKPPFWVGEASQHKFAPLSRMLIQMVYRKTIYVSVSRNRRCAGLSSLFILR